MTDKKECKRCGDTKALNLFVRQKSVKSGYSNICKKCKREQVNKYRRLNQKDTVGYNDSKVQKTLIDMMLEESQEFLFRLGIR